MRLSDVMMELECYEVNNRTERFSPFKKLTHPIIKPLFEVKILWPATTDFFTKIFYEDFSPILEDGVHMPCYYQIS